MGSGFMPQNILDAAKKDMEEISKGKYQKILFEKGPISRITLNEPERQNPFGHRLCLEMRAAMEQVMDDNECRVVLVNANGPNFSAGHDLHGTVGESVGARTYADDFPCLWYVENWYLYVWDYVKPIVTAVQGHVAAGAMEFVGMSDIVVASPDVKFGYSNINRLAIITSMGQVGAWTFGWHKYAEVGICGMRIGAEDALRYGMVNKVVPKEKLMDEALFYCENILKMPPQGVELNKRVIRHLFTTMGIRENMEYAVFMDMLGHMTKADKEWYGTYAKAPSPRQALRENLNVLKARWSQVDGRQEKEFADWAKKQGY